MFARLLRVVAFEMLLGWNSSCWTHSGSFIFYLFNNGNLIQKLSNLFERGCELYCKSGKLVLNVTVFGLVFSYESPLNSHWKVWWKMSAVLGGNLTSGRWRWFKQSVVNCSRSLIRLMKVDLKGSHLVTKHFSALKQLFASLTCRITY